MAWWQCEITRLSTLSKGEEVSINKAKTLRYPCLWARGPSVTSSHRLTSLVWTWSEEPTLAVFSDTHLEGRPAPSISGHAWGVLTGSWVCFAWSHGHYCDMFIQTKSRNQALEELQPEKELALDCCLPSPSLSKRCGNRWTKGFEESRLQRNLSFKRECVHGTQTLSFARSKLWGIIITSLRLGKLHQ